VKQPNDLSHKGVAVEEWIDLHFYRPIGIRIARALLPTSVSADQVTLWSILIGLLAGHLFVYHDPTINALGFVLFVISDMFDSVDGQLARLRKTSTRFGRALDGIGDNVRFINLYAHLAVRLIGLAGWHWYGLLLAVAAGLSHSMQSMSADFIRNAYLELGEGSGQVDLPEDLNDEDSSWLHRAGAWLYARYVRQQLQLFPRTVELIRRLRQSGNTSTLRSAYRERLQSALPLCSWLGQNIRFGLLGVTAIAGYPSAFLWTEVLAMNLLLFAVLLPIQETNSGVLSSSLEREARAY
jgi:hypothetical protein